MLEDEHVLPAPEDLGHDPAPPFGSDAAVAVESADADADASASCCDSCRQAGEAAAGFDAPALAEVEWDPSPADAESLEPTGWVIPEFCVPGGGGGSSRLTVVNATGTYAAGAADGFVKADASGGTVTVTLPAAQNAGSGKLLTVKKIDSSTNRVIVDGAGSETMDGLPDLTLRRQYETITLICDGTGWWIQSHST